MENFDDTLAEANDFSDETDTPPMLSSFDIERQDSVRKLSTALKDDPKEAIQQLLIDTIVHDQSIAKRYNKTHGMTFINAVKQLAECAGVSLAAEMDVMLELPDDPTEATTYLVKLRSEGRIKSKQAQDLSSLIEKKTQYGTMKEVLEFMKELQDGQYTQGTQGMTMIHREVANDG